MSEQPKCVAGRLRHRMGVLTGRCEFCGITERQRREREAERGRRRAGKPADGNRTEREITMAHHAACTCGGAGPGDGCPACEMWHALYPATGKGTVAP